MSIDMCLLDRRGLFPGLPSGSRGGFTGMPAGNCTVLVLNVVRAVMKEVHVWVHVLAGDRLGYINRVHFNADGAAVKRS